MLKLCLVKLLITLE